MIVILEFCGEEMESYTRKMDWTLLTLRKANVTTDDLFVNLWV